MNENKLLELQRSIKAIKKDNENSYFKSAYFDINTLLAEIKPIMNELGLTVIQPLKVVEGKTLLATKIIFGDKVLAESEMLLPEIQDPQKMGSAITYYRRYSLQSLLSLEAEDDDGNSAKPEGSMSINASKTLSPNAAKPQNGRW